VVVNGTPKEPLRENAEMISSYVKKYKTKTHQASFKKLLNDTAQGHMTEAERKEIWRSKQTSTRLAEAGCRLSYLGNLPSITATTKYSNPRL
jgi:hypothetical protein